MKVVGLITEYNPFHNGHLYHMEQARAITGADYCIAVMSGNYVQRGEPACMDKYLRAQIALLSGADLVLELPEPYPFWISWESWTASASAAKAGICRCCLMWHPSWPMNRKNFPPV